MSAEYKNNAETRPATPTPAETNVTPTQVAPSVEILPPETVIATAPLADTVRGLAARPGVFGGGQVGQAMMSAAFDATQNLAAQYREEAKESKRELRRSEQTVATLNEKLGRTEERLEGALGAKRVSALVATVGGILIGKGWALLDKPGTSADISWGFMACGVVLVAIAAVPVIASSIAAWRKKGAPSE